MEQITFTNKLQEAFDVNGLGHLLTPENKQKLFSFACLLVETNKTHNLTAIKDENGIILKHFVDCAAICEHIPNDASLIDVGCGAGFPSIPLAILREDLRIVSIDSTEKKIKFIDKTATELGLANIYPIAGRAEDFAQKARESFDVATSRAVARLNILDELCLPFVKIGGKFIAMKSSRGEEEFDEARKGISILGAKLESRKVSNFSYKGDSIEREIYIFAKTASTPDAYPRNYSQIVKKPL